MALKNMIKVGDKVTFGRSGEKKTSGTVIKCNPKTARIKVARCGEFLVTYNLIQKPRKKAAKKTAPKRKAAGKKICAVPVRGPRVKKNPPEKGAKRLVHEGSGREVKKGEILTDFRGKKWKLHDWHEGAGASTGRVYVTDLDEGFERAFYPSVFGLEWKPSLFVMKGGRKNPPKSNPANLTKKGEKIYEAIKKGYGRDPRAKEIAARTVYKMAHTKPGLVKKKRK